jgi:hypothetical protein
MKIYVDNDVVIELSDFDISVLKHQLKSEGLVDDIKRRIVWVVSEKINQCKLKILSDFKESIELDNESIPTKESDLLALIFSRDDYKDRDARDAEQEK